MAWLADKGLRFKNRIEFGTLDLSGPHREVFELMTPKAILVADPFHVCRHANTKLDECRRRVQNETMGTETASPTRSLPTPAHEGQGASRGGGPREAHRPAACRRAPCRALRAGVGGVTETGSTS